MFHIWKKNPRILPFKGYDLTKLNSYHPLLEHSPYSKTPPVPEADVGLALVHFPLSKFLTRSSLGKEGLKGLILVDSWRGYGRGGGLAVHIVSVVRKQECKQEMEPSYKASRPTPPHPHFSPSILLPSGRIHLLKIPQLSQPGPSSRNQVFKHMSLRDISYQNPQQLSIVQQLPP